MNKTKQEMRALLDETAAHYKTSNRALAPIENFGARCLYETPDGKQCAIGRKIPDLKLRMELNVIGGVSFHATWTRLPEDLKAFGQHFLTRVQSLHDHDDFWNEEGLTELGKSQYNSIVREFSLDVE